MRTCPSCLRVARDDARFCEACGAEISSTEEVPTAAIPPRRARSGDTRFLPGAMLCGRYRIVAPLGRGGMGEVYRADDIKLGQTVALKFLPGPLDHDSERLELLLGEVRLARQVSHPNICRVWDVGDAEGLHFIAMEYVDGEDLSSLLRRIGRLPEDRAVQVARELCAGLAAVHDQGLLHRDLKPSNVMLDGRGRVRITDFGLAALAESIDGADSRSGTPAYMAPEQRAGKPGVRSDVYSLGLILYEIFTGHGAFEGADRSKLRPDSQPSSPSEHVPSINPIIERAVLRCLEFDPRARPESALAVARALPGGDPLAVALAAGETPSPEMVAAAGGVGGLHPWIAVAVTALVIAGVIGLLAVSDRRGMPFRPADKPFAALRDRASELARAVGAATESDDLGDGYEWPAASEPNAGAVDSHPFYWYRRSPAALHEVWEERRSPFAIPALEVRGESAQRWSLDGRLIEFRRIPAARESTSTTAADYGPFFVAAGLAGEPRHPATARNLPLVPVTSDSAWTVHGEGGTTTVEAASNRGIVTFFAVGPPYVLRPVRRSDLAGSTIFSMVLILLFLGSLVLARRNLRAGRADARGAVRIVVAIFTLGGSAFVILRDPSIRMMGFLTMYSFGVGLFWATFTGSCYLALEPFVRRKHPGWLASWNRLLDGQWLDPLVGRDVLIGTLGGVVMGLIGETLGMLERRSIDIHADIQAAAVGGWTALGFDLRGLVNGIQIALLLALVLVVLQNGIRSDRWGWAAWLVLASLSLAQTSLATYWSAAILEAIVFAVILSRSGLTGAAVASWTFAMFNEECQTLHLGAWYANVTLATILAIALLVVWGFAAATRGTRGVRAATDA